MGKAHHKPTSASPEICESSEFCESRKANGKRMIKRLKIAISKVGKP